MSITRREWLQLPQGSRIGEHGHVVTPNLRKTRPLRVMTWNVLADGLAQDGDFIKVNPAHLQWSHRHPLIVDELMSSNADIIALQECSHFYTHILPALAPKGYTGTWLPKTPSPAESLGYAPDGLAVLYRQNVVRCVKEVSGSYIDEAGGMMAQVWGAWVFEAVDADSAIGRPAQSDLCAPNPHPEQNQRGVSSSSGGPESSQRDAEELPSAVGEGVDAPMRSEGCCQEASSASSLVVAVTHLKAKEGALNDQARTNQIKQLVHHINNVLSHTTCDDVPVVVMGDMNTTPDCAGFSQLKSGLGLRNVWDDVLAADVVSDVERYWSTWKWRSAGMKKRLIDYIWYRQCDVTSFLLPPPNNEQLSEYGLPNAEYPSDHIGLIADIHVH